MPTLQRNKDEETSSVPPSVAYEHTQRRRMLVALAVLLVALVLVIVKDRQFWFSSGPGSETEAAELAPSVMAAAPTTSPQPPAAVAAPAPDLSRTTVTRPEGSHAPAPAARAKAKKPAHVQETAKPAEAEAQKDETPFIVATNRAVLPPLEVEVVAGDQHRPLQSSTPGVKVEMPSVIPPSSGSSAPAQPSAVPPSSAARVQLSPGTVEVVSRPVEPNYPLLAKQMKVQGAVVLEALIGKEGEIQDIQVLSGPAILSAAAREAVKQWRFKPYLQSGQAVETEARITVNFTISTY